MDMKYDRQKYMNKTELSSYTGLSTNAVRDMVRSGRLRVESFGRWELVPIDVAEDLRRELEERKRLRVTPDRWEPMGGIY